MIRHISFFIGILWLAIAAECVAQGEAALPFLLISPGTEVNGMGEASVALTSTDPLASVTNPAQLGMQSLSNFMSAGTNYADWLPQFNMPDLWYRTSAVNAGINLKKLLGIEPEVGVGFGYSRIYMNYGDFFTTEPTGPEVTGKFHAYESADQYTIGAGIDYIIKASAGITFKHVYSQLGQRITASATQRTISTTVNTFDYGILLDIPLIKILQTVHDMPVDLLPGLAPYVDLQAGLAKNNLGDNTVVYFDPAQADPLPRYDRAGIGIDLGIEYNREDESWRPVAFKWTREANDILVNRREDVIFIDGMKYLIPHWDYQSSQIKIFDELILGKTNPETIMKKGWELNLLEFFAIRGGRFKEDAARGNRHFSTTGYGIQSAGIIKILKAVELAPSSDSIFGFLINHVNLRYNVSSLKTDVSGDPLDETKFHSVNITVSN